MTVSKTIVTVVSRLQYDPALERAATLISDCRMYTSMKPGGVGHCMNHVHIHETRYVLPYDHKKHREITEQVRFFGRHPKTSVNELLRTSQSMTVVFVRETALCQR